MAPINMHPPDSSDPSACLFFEVSMNFYCCGVRYSTNDPDTYFCIEKYSSKKPIKQVIGKQKIKQEDIYFIYCKKNDCIKTYIFRYSITRSGKKKLIEKEVISKRKASLEFKAKYLNNLKYKQIPMPFYKSLKQSKTIPFVYGKVTGSQTQQRRYIDESGYADYECINTPVVNVND